MNEVARLRDVSVAYGSGPDRVEAVSHVDLSIRRGVSVGVVGESGSGKSTLGKAMLGLLPLNSTVSGEVWLGGTRIDESSPEVLRSLRWTYSAMVFQDAMSALNPVIRVGHQVRDAIRVRRGVERRKAEVIAKELLGEVGIDSRRFRAYPHELSGGQRQRVMIALAISCDPALLVADEPTTALDVVVQAEILDLLDRLKKDLELALVFISHDLGAVTQVSDELLVMYAGQIVESGPTERVIRERAHPYTRALIDSFPRMDGRPVRALAPTLLSGASAPQVNGCRFAPRCPVRVDVCWTEDPPVVATGEGSSARCRLVKGRHDV